MSEVHDFFLKVFVAGKTHLQRLDDRGAGLVEYALLISLIMLVALSAVSFFGQETKSTIEVPPSMFEGG
jgi:Flp pilus assembly pilin Flp